MSTGSPDPSACNKAIKLLMQYERLAKKYGLKLSAKQLQRLDAKRDAGTITSSDLAGKLQSEFPNEFAGMTLDEIREVCNK